MSFEIPGFSESTRLSGEDLSTEQFKFVKLAPSGRIMKITAATDIPYGVLQNAPKVDMPCVMMRNGISRVKCAAALNPGVSVGPSANGRAEARVFGTDATKYVAGMVTEGSSGADAEAAVSFDCLSARRAV